MKNGLIFENGELYYYKDDFPFHAGVVEIDGDIYYIGEGGKAVTGEHVVHKSMANGILKRGTYKFGEDYKLIKDFYVAPKKRKRLSRKNRKRLKIGVTAFSCLLLLIFVFVLPSFINNRTTSDITESSEQISEEGKNLIVLIPEGEALLCTPEIKDYFDGTGSLADALSAGNPYRAFEFKYVIKNNVDGELTIGENQDISDGRKYLLESGERSLIIDNLKVNTTYYYSAQCGDDVIKGSFKTASSPRFAYFAGAYNVRDIGNVKTKDGKTIKQGMLIRGSELDGLVEHDHFLEDGASEAIQQAFGFVYDMDLRNPVVFLGDEYVSKLGEEVRHEFYGMPVYGNIFNENNKDIIKKIFSDLAKKDNYPMYFHCTHGADRTGVAIFLLQGILGVDEENMMKEYRLTSFYRKSYATNDSINIIVEGLDKFEGETINDRIYNYLVDYVGVPQEEIEAIRNILLEE